MSHWQLYWGAYLFGSALPLLLRKYLHRAAGLVRIASLILRVAVLFKMAMSYCRGIAPRSTAVSCHAAKQILCTTAVQISLPKEMIPKPSLLLRF